MGAGGGGGGGLVQITFFGRGGVYLTPKSSQFQTCQYLDRDILFQFLLDIYIYILI